MWWYFLFGILNSVFGSAFIWLVWSITSEEIAALRANLEVLPAVRVSTSSIRNYRAHLRPVAMIIRILLVHTATW
jgi:hypothetical protein